MTNKLADTQQGVERVQGAPRCSLWPFVQPTSVQPISEEAA